jgi:LysM repeat protein
MNQPTANDNTPSRSFETDAPRADLVTGPKRVNKKLWGGMAGAAVVATLSIAALIGPAATAPGAPSAAGAITTADAPDGQGTAPVVAAPAETPSAVQTVPAAADPVSIPAEAAAPAAAEPPPAAAPPPATDTNVYTVVPGDTVGGIAARHGVDMNAMLAANGLGAYSLIVPGQTLKLTGPAVVVSAPVPAPAQAATPAQAAVAPAPAAVPAAAALVPAAPAVRTIYVAGAGGQSMVDACIGPIHYTPNDGYSLFITEHDFCGGWARFSGIGVGETVSIPGYGTFKVTARGQVPNPGTTNDVIRVFGGFPRAFLQTSIPGTNQMMLISLN